MLWWTSDLALVRRAYVPRKRAWALSCYDGGGGFNSVVNPRFVVIGKGTCSDSMLAVWALGLADLAAVCCR